MIINYDRRSDADIDQKIQSLIDSIMLALNEKTSDGGKVDTSGIEKSITELRNSVTAAEEDISDLDGRMGTAETRINNHATMIAGNTGSIADLQSRMGDAESDIASLEQKVSITAAGTSGTFRYIKYSNGMYQAWDTWVVSTSCSYSSGNGWYRNQNAYTRSLPAVIGSTAILVAHVEATNEYANLFGTVTKLNASDIEFYLSHLGSYSGRSTTLNSYFFGTWS